MKFDLLYELQAPKPHDERSEYRCYQEALAQIELADRLGYDTVWEVEHHFLTEFAHSSAPSASRRSTSSPTGGSSSAPAARASSSRRASRWTPTSRARCGRSRSR